MALSVARLVQESGWAVVLDTSARVVDLARRHRPALILLDVQQLGGSGLELLAELRQNPATRGCRVIATATTDDDFARTVSLELGALAFVLKPFNQGLIDQLSSLAHPNPPSPELNAPGELLAR